MLTKIANNRELEELFWQRIERRTHSSKFMSVTARQGPTSSRFARPVETYIHESLKYGSKYCIKPEYHCTAYLP